MSGAARLATRGGTERGGPEPAYHSLSDVSGRGRPAERRREMDERSRIGGASRRGFLAALAAGGGGLAFAELLGAAGASEGAISRAAVAEAERLAGLAFSDDERDLLLEGLGENAGAYAAMREVPLANDVPLALQFRPDAFAEDGLALLQRVRAIADRPSRAVRPARDEDLAFFGVAELGELLAARKISSLELTRIYLDRLKRLDPQLSCVVHLLEERALTAARRADQELAARRARGPLHGIPWGAKDLLAAAGAPTTWGTGAFRDQLLPEDAAVVSRLERAGAVLLAKLSLGELAWGDVWYGGTTKNPWRLDQGSSGSSAGSAAATAAGLVGFAIGSETWGSIVSPCTRCGATGLRPTFGRVSRHGAMALSWTMDKLGPIARRVEDCALVFQAIAGADRLDPTVVDRPFDWSARPDPRKLRIGYVPALFDAAPPEGSEEVREHERAALDVLRRLGFTLVPVELPALPVEPLAIILTAEAGAAFDDFTRSGGVDTMVRQGKDSWPQVFRLARFVPAVEYLRANRIRSLLIREMNRSLAAIDALVTPSFGGDQLLLTNLTGHPAVVLPNGFRSDGTPSSLTFVGRLYGELEILTVADLYQRETGFHLRRPQL